MPFLSRNQIDPALLKKAESELRGRLRQRLQDPSLTAEQRAWVKQELSALGKPKVYDRDSPPRPGSISFSN